MKATGFDAVAFVLDASITASWYFDDEEAAEKALNRLSGEDALVPSLWWYEVRNILIAAERRGRIAEPMTAEILTDLAALPIKEDARPDSGGVLALARGHTLSVYDASYLELALRHQVPLATLDRRLAQAARAEGLSIIES